MLPVSGFGLVSTRGEEKRSRTRQVFVSFYAPKGSLKAVSRRWQSSRERWRRRASRTNSEEKSEKKNACVFTVSSSHVDVSAARSSVAESPRRDLRNTPKSFDSRTA